MNEARENQLQERSVSLIRELIAQQHDTQMAREVADEAQKRVHESRKREDEITRRIIENEANIAGCAMTSVKVKYAVPYENSLYAVVINSFLHRTRWADMIKVDELKTVKTSSG